jgi:anti-anti-sigma factor
MGEPDEQLTRHTITDLGDGSVELKLEGELDLSGTDQLGAAVEEAVASVTRTLVVDVSGLRFADSSAIALWVSWSQRVPRLEIRNPPPMILRVIQAMGLTTKLNPS